MCNKNLKTLENPKIHKHVNYVTLFQSENLFKHPCVTGAMYGPSSYRWNKTAENTRLVHYDFDEAKQQSRSERALTIHSRLNTNFSRSLDWLDKVKQSLKRLNCFVMVGTHYTLGTTIELEVSSLLAVGFSSGLKYNEALHWRILCLKISFEKWNVIIAWQLWRWEHIIFGIFKL